MVPETGSLAMSLAMMAGWLAGCLIKSALTTSAPSACIRVWLGSGGGKVEPALGTVSSSCSGADVKKWFAESFESEGCSLRIEKVESHSECEI